MKTPTLQPKPAWAQHLMATLRARDVKIDPKFASVADSILAEQLAVRTVSKAFGDGVAKQLTLSEDNQLTTAVDLLRQSTTQKQLFAAASRDK